MVSKKKEYIKLLEDTVESQRTVISSLLDKNEKLLKNLNLALTHPYYNSINNEQSEKEQQQQQQSMSLYDYKIDNVSTELQENMTALDYLAFGLTKTFGVIKSKKILNAVGSQLYTYLQDKDKMKYLLKTCGVSNYKLEFFIGWLISNKKYCRFPIHLESSQDSKQMFSY